MINHYTINLDVSGGDELTDTTVDISYNDNILESIPYIPTRRGYIFDGWNVVDEDGNMVADSTALTDDGKKIEQNTSEDIIIAPDF